jgi:aspartyl-tRNA(Asn)/glutamyl-tRNA(Gln) amidotransferase subunit C
LKITREDVLRVAELAHLDLTEAEIEMFSRQLDSILSYVDKLNELDTSKVEPMAQVAPAAASGQGATVGTPLREDKLLPCDIIGDVLAGAPDASPEYFRVPRVIER